VKKSFVITSVLFLALVPLSLGAQSAANAEFRILSFDIGYAPGWDLEAREQTTPSVFGLNIRLADNFSAGFKTFKEGGAIDNFLVLKYNFLPRLRAVVGFGAEDINGVLTPAGPIPASSIGVEAIPFSRSVGGLAVTEFKLAIEYDAPFQDVTEGRILFALAFGIGF
jgi:hypothetical protein